MNSWFRLGAFFMAAGVGLGAFGAHGLKGRLSADAMQIYQTAVFYHLVHALGLLAVAWAAAVPAGRPSTFVRFAGWAALALGKARA